MIDESHIAVEFIDVALSDFEASKLLFDGGFYPQALFMLQQSLEKAAKAILLKLKLVDIEELSEKMGHSIRRVSLESMVLKTVIDLMDSAVYELLAHLNEVKLYTSSDQKIAIDKICNEIKENVNRMIMVASNIVSIPGRRRGELYSMYSRVRVLGRKATSKIDEETLKEMNELMSEVNFEKLVNLIPSEITRTVMDFQKTVLSAMNYITSDEQRMEIYKTYEEHVDRFAMNFQLAIILYMLILWHKPFERSISQLRYPNHKLRHNPVNIKEDTTLTRWARMVIDKINELNMLKCIKELVNGGIESQKCRETLEFLKKNLISIPSTTTYYGLLG